MNNYKIPAPYSKSGKKVYVKIEIQSYKFNRKTRRTDRLGKMQTIRLDDVAKEWLRELPERLNKFLCND